MKLKKTNLYALAAAVVLALVAFFFFFPDAMEGRVLQQHDIQQGIANGEEARAFHEATGETTRWTDSLFGGMPTFQIAPSYPANDALGWITKVYTLWLPSPSNILFAMMLGFFIMCLCLRMKWYTSFFAALAWGFSTYFIIIIGAGHIWKFLTLAFIPPTIGGIALCYRGRYIGGTALASLFGALQLQSNHPQMSYYFLFVIFAMMMAWLWKAVKSQNLSRWWVATACTMMAGCIAVAANSSSLYLSLKYSQETVRGKSTALVTPGESNEGMSKDAITAWSYGPDETLTLLIPNVKGGASLKPEGGQNVAKTLDEVDAFSELPVSGQEAQVIAGFPQYFGDQPMTNGPVYVGAFVLVLALLSLFVCQGAMIWALFAVSILAILLSWGHNFAGFTNFFIDNFPGYNKFRTVSSILVIVEFTLPLMAAMCLRTIIKTPDFFKLYKWQFYTVAGVVAFVCFLGWVAPGVFGGGFSQNEMDMIQEAGVWDDPAYIGVWHGIEKVRMSMVSADSLRSLFFVVMGSLILWLYFRKAFTSAPLMVMLLAVLVTIDLFSVNKRYVDSDNFLDPAPAETTFAKSAADELILQDEGHYRVCDVLNFNGARSSYFHKTVGGYHAAKLTRYSDLVNRQLNPLTRSITQWLQQGNPADSLLVDNQVLNMLNTKYFLIGNQVVENPYANGPAWLVDSLVYVANANEEFNRLDQIHTGHVAVSDKKYEKELGQAGPLAPGDSVWLEKYAPNRLEYGYRTAKEAVAVFSEVYFPWGWTATLADGKELPIAQADYALRALRLPAGSGTVTFRFDPKQLHATDAVSWVAVGFIYLLCLAALALVVLRLVNGRKTEEKKD